MAVAAADDRVFMYTRWRSR